ncbi:MAG: hypothetical protein ACOX8S_05440 [Christensenellales bacterium]|jgi:hypothetical protein
MKKRKNQKKEWQDDGRVIAGMDVDGMNHGLSSLGSKLSFKKKRDEFGQEAPKSEPIILTRAEKRSIKKGVVMAHLALLVGVVALAGLVMLLISKIWFR